MAKHIQPVGRINSVTVEACTNGYIIRKGRNGPDQQSWVARSDNELHEVLVNVLAGIPVDTPDRGDERLRGEKPDVKSGEAS